MEKIKLNEGWRVFTGEEPVSFAEIPESAKEAGLPYDALPLTGRDYTVPLGFENSYYPTVVSVFFKQLPVIGKAARVYLEIEGTLGACDVYVDGRFIAFATGRARRLIDITDYYKNGALVAFRIVTHPDTGKYVGNGIAGGVAVLVFKETLSIAPYGVRVSTKASGEKTLLGIFAEVENIGSISAAGELTAEIFNEKQRRVAKKIKKIKLAAGAKKIIEIPVRLAKAYEWTKDDPYLYTCAVSVGGSGAQKASFGVARHELTGKAYRLNGKAVKLKGAVLAHDNGMLGAASDPAAEYRKLSAIKEIGYNAVRYIGCPAETALDTLDKLGLLCVVDIFDCLEAGARSGDGHASFLCDWENTVAASVKTLRNHPSVAFYSIANDAPESYGRGRGYALVKRIAEKIKEINPAALLTANAFERVPDKLEAERFDLKTAKGGGDKQMISAAREKDLFGKLTEEYFSAVDAAGYSYLYPRFSSDKSKFILGLADQSAKASDVFEETDKNQHVLGCFLNYGADFLGSAQMPDGYKKPCVNEGGDLDITFRRKSGSYYKEILLGKRGVCTIVVQDPDARDPDGPDHLSDVQALWNWPRHVGKPVKIVVYTSGDIVSLSLDGKSVGRKLAGKFNNYTAVFKTNYYPGKLEAVSFYKGAEHARCMLETVSQPKSIKLECAKKIIAPGECTYVDIIVADKEGRTVPFATREVEISVSEEGEFVAAGTADPFSTRNPALKTCTVYDGRATAVVRGKSEGKMIVKVSGEGLLSNKITVKVK